MSATPKLTYFQIAGRGEAIRLAFFLGGVDFQDHRISFSDWPALKSGTPFGGIPTLEINGVTYGQSSSLLRYAGKASGLYPSDPIAALRADEIVDAVEDLYHASGPSFREKDEQKKAALVKNLVDETFPHSFSALEKVLERNGSSPFVLGKDISIADLKLSVFLEGLRSGMIAGIPKDMVDKYPKLAGVRDGVASHPKVQEWKKAHP